MCLYGSKATTKTYLKSRPEKFKVYKVVKVKPDGTMVSPFRETTKWIKDTVKKTRKVPKPITLETICKDLWRVDEGYHFCTTKQNAKLYMSRECITSTQYKIIAVYVQKKDVILCGDSRYDKRHHVSQLVAKRCFV